MAIAERLSADTTLTDLLPKTKVRVGKVYVGRPRAGWPTPQLNLDEEIRRFESNLAKLGTEFADIEFEDVV